MAFYQFTVNQHITAGIEEVWEFISAPDNLKQITPPSMDFTVTGNSGGKRMYEGMIITYRVKPLSGIPVRWMTEITHVKDKAYFVDEQRVGPYRLWHHQHHITAVGDGVLMTDIVTYMPPLGFIGALANRLFIKKKLKEIFDYRFKAVELHFSKGASLL